MGTSGHSAGRLKSLSVAALMLFAWPVAMPVDAALPKTTPANTSAADSPGEQGAAQMLNELRERDKRIQSLEREGAVMRAKSDLDQSAYSRLENYIGAFGVLITLVALVFGLSTREAAVAAARRGIEDEIRAIKTLLGTARALLNEIQKHAQDAEAIKNKMASQAQPSDFGTRQSDTEVAEADSTESTEWTPSDQPVDGGPETSDSSASPDSQPEAITKDSEAVNSYASYSKSYFAALRRGDFVKARDVAREARRHYKKNVQIADSFFREGYALERLGKYDLAIKCYEKCISRLKNDRSPYGSHVNALALYNLALIYGDNLKDRPRELELYDQAVKLASESRDKRARLTMAKALVNKAVELAKLGRVQEALATDEQVISMFSDSEDEELEKQVKMSQRHSARLTKPVERGTGL